MPIRSSILLNPLWAVAGLDGGSEDGPIGGVPALDGTELMAGEIIRLG